MTADIMCDYREPSWVWDWTIFIQHQQEQNM